MAENFPKAHDRYQPTYLKHITNPRRVNSKKTTSRHTMGKLPKTKDINKIFKTAREKRMYFLRSNSKNDDSLLTEAMEVRRKWNGIFKLPKRELSNLEVYTQGDSFKNKGKHLLH